VPQIVKSQHPQSHSDLLAHAQDCMRSGGSLQESESLACAVSKLHANACSAREAFRDELNGPKSFSSDRDSRRFAFL